MLRFRHRDVLYAYVDRHGLQRAALHTARSGHGCRSARSDPCCGRDACVALGQHSDFGCCRRSRPPSGLSFLDRHLRIPLATWLVGALGDAWVARRRAHRPTSDRAIPLPFSGSAALLATAGGPSDVGRLAGRSAATKNSEPLRASASSVGGTTAAFDPQRTSLAMQGSTPACRPRGNESQTNGRPGEILVWNIRVKSQHSCASMVMDAIRVLRWSVRYIAT